MTVTDGIARKWFPDGHVIGRQVILQSRTRRADVGGRRRGGQHPRQRTHARYRCRRVHVVQTDRRDRQTKPRPRRRRPHEQRRWPDCRHAAAGGGRGWTARARGTGAIRRGSVLATGAAPAPAHGAAQPARRPWPRPRPCRRVRHDGVRRGAAHAGNRRAHGVRRARPVRSWARWCAIQRGRSRSERSSASAGRPRDAVIASFLFQTTPTDPGTFAAVAVTLAVTGCLAAWVPARRAARVDPVTALRVE